MAAELFSALPPALDTNGDPISGAKWKFYATGTLTPLNVYGDAGLGTSLGSSVTANGAGVFEPVFFDSASIYRARQEDADGNLIENRDIDPVNSGVLGQLASGDLITSNARPFESFLDADYDYTADDVSAELAEAWAWSITSNRPVSFTKRYRIANTPVLSGAGNFHFVNAHFDVLDTGALGTVFGSTQIMAGMVVKSATGARMTGAASFIGSGTTLGTTRLCGIMFYKLDGSQILANFHFENMSEGGIASYCTNSVFGDMSGKNLHGTQPFDGTGTGGTTQVVYGCEDCQFGRAYGEQVFKPIRYMSLGTDADANTTSNTRLQFGETSGTGRDGSAESSLLSIRCAKDCQFGQVTGGNVSVGLLIIRYSGDNAYSLDGNFIAGVKADSINSAASGDAVLSVVTTGPAVGFNRFGTVSGTGEVYGVLLQSGDTEIGSLDVDAPQPFEPSAGAKFDIGLAKITGFSTHGVTFNAVTGRIRELQINSGTTGTANTYHGVFNAAASANSSLVIDQLTYTQNGVGNNLAYVFQDSYSSPTQVQVKSIVGAGATGIASWVGGFVPGKVRDGFLYVSAAPTTGTWAAADTVRHQAPASGGIWGWVCVTGGTPGTWTPIGVVGQIQAATVSALSQTISGSYTQAEVQAISTKVDAILSSLKTAKVMA